MDAATAAVASRATLTRITSRCLTAPGSARRARGACAHRPLRSPFEDGLQGHVVQDVRREVGDFVVQRLEGHAAYQLAVVVDDAAQHVSEVVRGADLLDSTPRQMVLQQLLGMPTPDYLHLPLLLDGTGQKLSKQNSSLPVDGADPLPALFAVLAILGINREEVPRDGGATRVLNAAIQKFDVTRLPRQRTLPAPMLQPRNAGE